MSNDKKPSSTSRPEINKPLPGGEIIIRGNVPKMENPPPPPTKKGS